jgi:hypothetical protein
MDAKTLENFFAALKEIVNSEEMRWTDKSKKLNEYAQSEHYGMEFEEFLSWFGGDTE